MSIDAKGKDLHEDDFKSIVRSNLMQDKLYRPYCGNGLTYGSKIPCSAPRVKWDFKLNQFICPECGWVSQFPDDFIARYKEVHDLK